MTKSIVITKEEIIKALKTEKLLYSGSFIDRNQQSEVCAVCAVGSVLRSKGLEYDQIDAYGTNLIDNNKEDLGGFGDMEQVSQLLSKNRYMAALSCFYEMIAQENRFKRNLNMDVPATNHERLQSIRFVKARFPDKIKIIL
jgi:hypothetical protein